MGFAYFIFNFIDFLTFLLLLSFFLSLFLPDSFNTHRRGQPKVLPTYSPPTSLQPSYIIMGRKRMKSGSLPSSVYAPLYYPPSFRMSSKHLSPAIKQQYLHRVLMEHKSLDPTIVPSTCLYAMHQISFKEAARSTLEANAKIRSTDKYMNALYTAIIYTVYF